VVRQLWWKNSLAEMGAENLIIDIHPFHLINFLPYEYSESAIYDAFLDYLSEGTETNFSDVWGANEIWSRMKELDLDESDLLHASYRLGLELWEDAAHRRGLENENYLYKVLDNRKSMIIGDYSGGIPLEYRAQDADTSVKICVDNDGRFHIWPESLILTGPTGWLNSIARNIADSSRLISKINDKLHDNFFRILEPEEEQGFFDSGIEFSPIVMIDDHKKSIEFLQSELELDYNTEQLERLDEAKKAIEKLVEVLAPHTEGWGEETQRVMTRVPLELDDESYVPGFSTLSIGTLFDRLSSSIESIDATWLRDEPQTPILLGSPCHGKRWMHWRNGLVSARWTGPADFDPDEEESSYSGCTGDNANFNCLCDIDTISLASCMLHYNAETISSKQGRRESMLVALLDDLSDPNRAHDLLERNLGPARNVLRELGIEDFDSLSPYEVTRYVTTLFGLQRLDRQKLPTYFSNKMSTETDIGTVFSWLDEKLVELFQAWVEILPILLTESHIEFQKRFTEPSEEITKAAGGRMGVNFSKPTWGGIISFLRFHQAYMKIDENYESQLKEKMLPRSVELAKEETIKKLECISHQRNYHSHTDAILNQEVYKKVGWRNEQWDNSELIRNVSTFLEELYYVENDICSQPTRMLVTGINNTTHGSFAELYCLRNGLRTKLRLNANSNKIFLSANNASTPIRVGQRLLVWPTTNPDLVDPVVLINR